MAINFSVLIIYPNWQMQVTGNEGETLHSMNI